MLGRNGNIAYVRYNSQGRIVPGGPILSRQRPKVGNWQPLSLVTGNSVTSNSLRAFVRIDAYGRVVASSLLLLSGAPSDADSGTYWLEINATYRPYVPTTTTTSTTLPVSTTTTTSTTDPYYYYLTNKYNCPDCSTIVESNFLIKGAIAVNIGDWVIRNPGTGFIAFQVLSIASPNPSAYFVDTGGSDSTCPCPTTTTTTTAAPSTTTTTTASPTYTIGQAALGGIIAYILQPGDPGYIAGEQHGLVVTSSDLSNSTVLGCDGITITGANGINLGTGQQNSIDFLSQCSGVGGAFDLCSNYSNGGYSDWYLPSLGELDKIHANRSLIGGTFGDNYWSSTNPSAIIGNFSTIWMVRNFVGGAPDYVTQFRLSDVMSTRAIRYF
jgi:hypothetical protein